MKLLTVTGMLQNTHLTVSFYWRVTLVAYLSGGFINTPEQGYL
jgi:hypothetical protein